jgi:hypothetical protein
LIGGTSKGRRKKAEKYMAEKDMSEKEIFSIWPKMQMTESQ